MELLVPVLQERGLMWMDYDVPGGTYRENLLGTPGHPGVPDGHPAANYKYSALKERYGVQDNGDIIIDRRTSTAPEPTKPINPSSNIKTNGVSATVAEIKVGA